MVDTNPKYDEYQRGLASMVDKKSAGANTSGGVVKSEIMPNQLLLLEKLKNEKYTHLLKTVLGVLI